MNDVKNILDRTLPSEEPPFALDADDLLGRGQRRQRRRRIGFASGGGATAVAAVAAITLLLPGGGGTPGPAPAANDDTTQAIEEPTDPEPDETTDELTTDELDEHTEYLRTTFGDQFPQFVLGPPVFDDRDPFSFVLWPSPEWPSAPWSTAASVESSDGERIGDVIVELYEAGTGWTTEPAEMSRWAFHVRPDSLYSCYTDDGKDSNHVIETTCTETTGPDGEDVVVIVQRTGSPGNFDSVSVGAVVFRSDGTAVKGYFECNSGDEDEETSAASCSIDTMPADVIAEILFEVPTIPAIER